MFFRDTKDIKNWAYMQFETEGRFDIPVIQGVDKVEPATFVGYNYAKSLKKKGDLACHFYLDDYLIDRVWNRPEMGLQALTGFKYVLSPDFSLYMDYPEAVQVFNHYRKHWCAAYWQACGLTVVPTICWSDERSFEWCFDGEPHHSAVSIATLGVMKDKESQRVFMEGYNRMIETLEPTQILAYGFSFRDMSCLDGDNVVKIFNKRFRK